MQNPETLHHEPRRRSDELHELGRRLRGEKIREIPTALLEKIGKVNIAELTAEQMDDLGFIRWSEENPMRLIPLWLYQFLPDEIETECIDGEKFVLKRADMDNDHRLGWLAYGIWPNEKAETPRT